MQEKLLLSFVLTHEAHAKLSLAVQMYLTEKLRGTIGLWYSLAILHEGLVPARRHVDNQKL